MSESKSSPTCKFARIFASAQGILPSRVLYWPFTFLIFITYASAEKPQYHIEAPSIHSLIQDAPTPAPESVSPEIQAALQSMLDRITTAARARYPDVIRNVRWNIRIRPSDEINATVGIADRQRARRSQDIQHVDEVEITTGLLDLFFAEARTHGDEDHFQEALESVAAVIAHEIGHSIDFSRNPNASSEGSLKEVRADGFAIPLLADADFRRGALNRGFRLLARASRQAGGVASRAITAYVSTHPTNHFRTIQGELGVVADQMLRGSPRLIPVNANRENFMAELARAVLPGTPPSEVAPQAFPSLPQTIGDTASALLTHLTQLSRFSDDRHWREFDQAIIKLRAMVDHLDDLLLRPNVELSTHERELIFDFVRRYSRDELRAPRNSREMLLLSERHFQILNTIPFFRSSEYIEFLHRELTPGFQSIEQDTRSPDRWAFRKTMDNFCPADSFAAVTRRRMREVAASHQNNTDHLKVMATSLSAVIQDTGSFLSIIAYGNPKAFPMSEVYQQTIDALPIRDRARFLLHFVKSNPRLHPQLRMGALGTKDATIAYVREQQQVGQLESMARSVWNDRGLYAALGLLQGNYHSIDWPLVCEVLNIPEAQARAELNTAVRGFLRSVRYPELLQASVEIDPVGPEVKAGSLGYPGNLWLESDHWHDLMGEVHALRPHLAQRAQQVGGKYLLDHPEAFRSVYRRELKTALRRRFSNGHEGPTAQQIQQVFESVVAALGTGNRHSGLVYDLQIELLSELGLPPENLRVLLRELYVDAPGSMATVLSHFVSDQSRIATTASGHFPEVAKWAFLAQNQHSLKVYRLLRSAGAVPRPSEFSQTISARASAGRNSEAQGFVQEKFGITEHFQVVHGLAPALMEELGSLRSKNELFDFAGRIYDPPVRANLNRSSLYYGQPVSRLTAAVIEHANRMNLDADEAHRLFLLLTQHGATIDTDRFYEQRLRPESDSELSSSRLHELRSFAADVAQATRPQEYTFESEGTTYHHFAPNRHLPTAPAQHRRIASSRMRAEIARRVLDDEIAGIAPAALTPDRISGTLDHLMDQIENMTEAGSDRDAMIESLAWDLDVRDRTILERMEGRKSTSWNFANPTLIRQGSALTEIAETLTPGARHDAIEYFIRPEGPLPQSVVDAVTASVQRELGEHSSTVLENNDVQRRVGEAVRNLETAAHSASPYERIPALMLLLRTGENPPMQSADYPRNIIREYLGIAARSDDEKAMVAFLRTVGPDEAPTYLSGMLALHHHESSGRWRPMFEIFTGVGVKAGQLASIFALLGAQATQELRTLRDRARPLSKLQIENILHETFANSSHERALIKRVVRVLGSASMKTVALVELVDGRRVVAMVQAPNASAQNLSNLERARRFVAELRSEGIAVPRFMDDIIAGTARQMVHEERMTQEVESTLRAQRMYEDFNSSMRGDLDGWRFHVPGPIAEFTPRDHLVFMEYAPGIRHENIRNKKTMKHVGRMILRSGLRGFFRRGLLNADPHEGNYIVDEDTKTIHPIDFGQTETYRITEMHRSFAKFFGQGDDIYNFSQFLRAAKTRDVDRMLHFGHRLTSQSSPETSEHSRNRQQLRTRLVGILNEQQSSSDLIIAITDAFSHHEFAMDHRFSFGALKALLIYQREQFGGEGDLVAELSDEVTHALAMRAGTVARDAATTAATEMKSCIMGALQGLE